jgi:hypothetical protein
MSIPRGVVRRLGEGRSGRPATANQELIMTTTNTPSRRRLWTGRVLSGLVVAFLIFDATIKVMKLPFVLEASKQLGFSEGSIFGVGLVLLACTVTYLVPRFSLVGALLITGYLGGAIATHVRMGNPLFSHTLFPIYVAALVWGGLYLRDPRVRALIAPRPSQVAA